MSNRFLELVSVPGCFAKIFLAGVTSCRFFLRTSASVILGVTTVLSYCNPFFCAVSSCMALGNIE
jgi:hypothetical protein